jgi:hypothetical protein
MECVINNAGASLTFDMRQTGGLQPDLNGATEMDIVSEGGETAACE